VIARLLLGRDRLSGDHRLVDRRAALEHDAVDRHLLAGAHAQPVAGLHGVERHVGLGAVRGDPARRRRGHAEELPDRGARGAPRAQLEHLAEQDQRDDHARGLEVGADRAVVHAERRRKRARDERGGEAVAERDRDPEPDQREHVEAAVRERLREPDVERPRGPRTHGQGERELEPDARAARRDRDADHLAHRDREQRQRERRRDPEPPRHVAQLGIRPGLERRHARLERHAADRAAARRVPDDLRVHRARVLDVRARGRRGRGRRGRLGELRSQVLFWIRDELRLAAGAAEQHLVTAVRHAVLRGRLHGHATDRVLRGRRGGGRGGVVIVVVMMRAVVVRAVVLVRAGRSRWGHGGLLLLRRDADPPITPARTRALEAEKLRRPAAPAGAIAAAAPAAAQLTRSSGKISTCTSDA
jgi:hypothetical protein